MSLNLNKVRNVFLNEQHRLRALDYKYHKFRNDRKFRMSDYHRPSDNPDIFMVALMNDCVKTTMKLVGEEEKAKENKIWYSTA